MNSERVRVETLLTRLREHVRLKVRSRQASGLDLAREADIPQGHLSNFLNARRGLSLESVDRLLDALHIGLLDLMNTTELREWVGKADARSRYDVVPRIPHNLAMIPRIPKTGVLEVHCVDKSMLRRQCRSNDVADRAMWHRFVYLRFDTGEIRAIAPTASRGATLLVDRHYTGLEPYRSRQNVYVVRSTKGLIVGRVSLTKSHIILQPCDQKSEISTIALSPLERYIEHLVGRVCHVRFEP